MAKNEVAQVFASHQARVQVGPSYQTQSGNLFFHFSGTSPSSFEEQLKHQIWHLTRSFFHFDYTTDFEDRIHIRRDGKWFMQNKQIESWARHRSYNILWLTGSPGMGKSALIVWFCQNYLSLNPQTTSKSQIALYSLCNNRENNTASKVISIAIHQLLVRLEQDDWKRIISFAEELSLATNLDENWSKAANTLWKFFCKIVAIAPFKLIFLVIDGFDECDRATQIKLFDLLKEGHENLRVLLSSQPLECVAAFLSKPPQLSLCGKMTVFDLHDEDTSINDELVRFIYREVCTIAERRHWSTQQSEQVIGFLNDRISSIFLPIVLVLEKLSTTMTDQVETILAETDNKMDELNDLYQALLRRLDERVVESQIFSTVACSFRSLGVSEMMQFCGYTSQGPSEEGWEKERLRFLADLRLCGPMLRVRTSDDTVQFIHNSARDFLMKQSTSQNSSVPKSMNQRISSHIQMACHCLKAIIESSGKISQAMPSRYEDSTDRCKLLQSLMDQNQLVIYSQSYWYKHVQAAYDLTHPKDERLSKVGKLFSALAKSVERDNHGRFVEFLSQPNFEISRQSFAQLRTAATTISHNKLSPQWLTIYHTTGTLDCLGFYARFGNVALFNEYIRDEPTCGYLSFRAAMYNAALSGDASLFRCILAKYRDLSLGQSDYSELIDIASGMGSNEILIQIRESYQPRGRQLEDAISGALKLNDYDVVTELLKGWDPRSKDIMGLNILHALASGRCNQADKTDVLKIWPYIKHEGLSINDRDHMGNTVLHHLSYSVSKQADADKEIFLELIEDLGADPTIRNKAGALPVHLAARRLDSESFEYLFRVTEAQLKRARNSMAVVVRPYYSTMPFKSKGALTPLHWAMARTDDVETSLVIRHLLSLGFRLDQESRSGRMPIHVAMDNLEIFNTLQMIATPLSRLNMGMMSADDGRVVIAIFEDHPTWRRFPSRLPLPVTRSKARFALLNEAFTKIESS